MQRHRPLIIALAVTGPAIAGAVFWPEAAALLATSVTLPAWAWLVLAAAPLLGGAWLVHRPKAHRPATVPPSTSEATAMTFRNLLWRWSWEQDADGLPEPTDIRPHCPDCQQALRIITGRLACETESCAAGRPARTDRPRGPDNPAFMADMPDRDWRYGAVAQEIRRLQTAGELTHPDPIPQRTQPGAS